MSDEPMKTWHCATCARADRVVSVQSVTAPSVAETHKAHRGYGLGLGNHDPAEMVAGHAKVSLRPQVDAA